MIFWDASAIVPLLAGEERSVLARRVATEDAEMVVWWGTHVECLSAIARRERTGELSQDHADAARSGLEEVSSSWFEVQASSLVRDHAARLLRRHSLRAADALQLGAALTWCGGEPEQRSLFSLDDRVASVARSEGFRLVARSTASPGNDR